MHCKNILFENGKLSGCIDFDKTQKNARIFDVCHMARSILIDYRDDIESRSNWSKFFGAILSGYISLHKLTHEEKQILPYMLCCIELLFIAYFLDIKHSEYCQVSVEMFNWLYANKDEFYNQYQVNSLQLIEGGASWVVSPSGDKFTKLTR